MSSISRSGYVKDQPSSHTRLVGPVVSWLNTYRTDVSRHTGLMSRGTADGRSSVTLRVNGRLHHIGVGRTHTGTDILLLVQDLHIRVIHAATGELLRDLILDPRSSQGLPAHPPTTRPSPQMTAARTHNSWVRASVMS